MFTKAITNSSEFLMMPPTTQLLYIHFGMNADDDGFCEIFPIMRMTDSKPDDLRVLQARNFVRIFDDKVLIIVDWKENNYLRNDRYTPSKYLEIYKEELKRLSSGIPLVDQVDTQDRLGKVRKGKVNTESDPGVAGEDISVIINAFKEINPAYKKWFGNTTQRSAASRLIQAHGLEVVLKFVEALKYTNAQPYAPTVTTVLQLEDKLADLKAWSDKQKNKSSSKSITI